MRNRRYATEVACSSRGVFANLASARRFRFRNMKSTSLTAVLLIMASAAAVFAQDPPAMKPTGHGPPKLPDTTISQQPSGVRPVAPSSNTAPAYEAAPKPIPLPPEPPSDMAVEKARQAEVKRRMAEEMFRQPKVTLDRTTEITQGKDGAFSGRALFSVQDRRVAIICTTTDRAAATAFLESINTIFARNRSADLSLAKIVERAREDLRKQPGLSDGKIEVQYIDQFGDTHVVRISQGRSPAMLAKR